MDLSSPLHSLVPALAASTLEVLAGTQSGLGTMKIYRLSGVGSQTGHQKSLDRLVEHGLVLAEPANRGYLYKLNREHVLTPALLAALNARREFIARLTTDVTSLQPRVAHASIFGSFARGEGTVDSDIDLLLVVEHDDTRDSEQWREQLRSLGDRVLAWTGNRLEPLVFSLMTLRDAVENEEPIIHSVALEHIPVVGSDFTPLIKRIAGTEAKRRTTRR